MKYLILIILIFGVSFAGCDVRKSSNDTPELVKVDPDNGEIEESTWQVDYDTALAVAKKRELPILINFSGSDWCSWCIKLDNEVFSKQEFLDWANDNIVLLKLDFPRNKNLIPADQQKKNQAVMEQYGIQGFPTIVLLDKDGETIGQTGYRPGGPGQYITHLKELLGK